MILRFRPKQTLLMGVETRTVTTEGMPIVPNALIFLLGQELDQSLAIQNHLFKAGVHNPLFALRGFTEARVHLLNLAHDQDWDRATEHHLAIISMDQEGAALDFLQWMRTHPKFKGVIRFVLENFASTADLQRALKLGAHGFFSRKLDLDEVAAAIARLSLVRVAPSATAPTGTTLSFA